MYASGGRVWAAGMLARCEVFVYVEERGRSAVGPAVGGCERTERRAGGGCGGGSERWMRGSSPDGYPRSAIATKPTQEATSAPAKLNPPRLPHRQPVGEQLSTPDRLAPFVMSSNLKALLANGEDEAVSVNQRAL